MLAKLDRRTKEARLLEAARARSRAAKFGHIRIVLSGAAPAISALFQDPVVPRGEDALQTQPQGRSIAFQSPLDGFPRQGRRLSVEERLRRQRSFMPSATRSTGARRRMAGQPSASRRISTLWRLLTLVGHRHTSVVNQNGLKTLTPDRPRGLTASLVPSAPRSGTQ
jgi:hypothetical protein